MAQPCIVSHHMTWHHIIVAQHCTSKRATERSDLLEHRSSAQKQSNSACSPCSLSRLHVLEIYMHKHVHTHVSFLKSHLWINFGSNLNNPPVLTISDVHHVFSTTSFWRVTTDETSTAVGLENGRQQWGGSWKEVWAAKRTWWEICCLLKT